ncbi:MAG TPA: alpha/beta hydrolase [Acidimicrobiales bacterium]|nr:alpha/beta hydrolase [Acidimicrobiales bacterium]
MAADGVEVVVHDLGGRGPVLLFAHAAGFHGRVWAPLADHLTDRFRCVAFDARGHGESGAPVTPAFCWQELALDVLAVVDALELEHPYGVGHSSGGTALLLAEEDRPGTFAGLYCFEPVIVPAEPPLGRDPDNWLAAAARRRRNVFASCEEAYEHYAKRPSLAGLDPAVLDAYVSYGFDRLPGGSVRLKCQPEHEARIYEMATAHDCFGRLGEVSCPVLLACGGASEACRPGAAREIAACLPRLSTEKLPGLGHLGPLEAPATVAASIARYVSTGPPGEAPPA